MSARDCDVVIVGASLAGCTAAALLGEQGVRVSLLERQRRPDAYKALCSHYLQSSATPTLERLGLTNAIDAAGGVRNNVHMWTRFGWIEPEVEASPAYPFAQYGYNLTRRKLDPLLRNKAAETVGVDVHYGVTCTDLVVVDGAVCGVRVRERGGQEHTLTARLVVGADGRGSTVARLAKIKTRESRNNRAFFFAYYHDLDYHGVRRSRLWLFDPDACAMFPNEDGISVAACTIKKDRVRRRGREHAAELLEELFAAAPLAPSLDRRKRSSPVFSKFDMPNIHRAPTAPGLALIGDACVATDPLWGVGCGFAMQSGEWLADSVGEALLAAGEGLPATLQTYSRTFKQRLGGHFLYARNYATGRRLNALERLTFRAAARDSALAIHMHNFGTRNISLTDFLTPRALARTVSVNLGRPQPVPESSQERRSLRADDY